MTDRTKRWGVPAMVWIVAGLLWVVSTGAVAIWGEHPVSASRAALLAVACFAAGAVVAALTLTVRRRADIVVTLALILASQAGRGYLDSADAVSGASVVIVVVGSVVVFAASRAVAARAPAREGDVEPT